MDVGVTEENVGTTEESVGEIEMVVGSKRVCDVVGDPGARQRSTLSLSR